MHIGARDQTHTQTDYNYRDRHHVQDELLKQVNQEYRNQERDQDQVFIEEEALYTELKE